MSPPEQRYGARHAPISSLITHIGSEEQAAVNRLMNQLIEAGLWDQQKHDIFSLQRFMKARNWNIDDAKKMWLAMLEWRSKWQADTILQEQILTPEQRSKLMKVYPHGLHGVDAKGRPVLVYKLGATNLQALRADFGESLLKRIHIQLYEFIMRVALPACSLVLGTHVSQVTTIIDLDGMGLWDMPKLKDLLLPSMSMNGDNYPETLAQMVIINAPSMFNSAFDLIKKMLSPDTQKKIQILGRTYQSQLSQLVPKDDLLREHGGTSDSSLADGKGPWQQSQLQQLLLHPNPQQPSTVEVPAGHAHGHSSHLHDVVAHEGYQTCRSDAASWLNPSTLRVSTERSPAPLSRSPAYNHASTTPGSTLATLVAAASTAHPLQSARGGFAPNRRSSGGMGGQLHFPPPVSTHESAPQAGGPHDDAASAPMHSMASFHSCLSLAESVALTAYLRSSQQQPLRSSGGGGRPTAGTAPAFTASAAHATAGASHPDTLDEEPSKAAAWCMHFKRPNWFKGKYKAVKGDYTQLHDAPRGADLAAVKRQAGAAGSDFEWDDEQQRPGIDQNPRAGAAHTHKGPHSAVTINMPELDTDSSTEQGRLLAWGKSRRQRKSVMGLLDGQDPRVLDHDAGCCILM